MDLNFEVSVSAELSDMLSRAQLLERELDFTLPLSPKEIYDDSISVMVLGSENRDEVQLNAELFLKNISKQKSADGEKPREDLRKLDFKRILEENICTTFSDISSTSFTQAMVSAIRSVQDETNRLTEDVIARTLGRNSARRDARDMDATVRVFEFRHARDMGGLEHYRAVSPKTEFFAGYLTEPPARFARAIADGVRKREGLFSDEVQRIADTFEIVACVCEAGGEVWRGCLRFMEKQMKRFIEDEVNANLRNTQRGGEIGIIATIKGYLTLQEVPKDAQQWAVMYYAIRCGEYLAALEYAKGKDADFDGDVITALRMMSQDMQLSGALKTSLMAYLNREVTSAWCDMYKVIVLSVLTNTNRIPDSGSVIQSIEDWLWLRLHFTHDLSAIAGQIDMSTFEEEAVNPFKSGQVYMLTGRFKEAAEWFLGRTNNANENLHFVLAMHVSSLVDYSVIKEALAEFVSDLFAADPVSAVGYLSKIRDREDRVRAIAELAIVAADGFSVTEPYDGGKSPLARVLEPEEQRLVIRAAGDLANKRGDHALSAKFFRLVNDYDQIVDRACVDLLQCVEGFRGQDVVDSSVDLYNEIHSSGAHVTPQRDFELKSMISLAWASVLCREGRYSQAATQVEQTNLFPVDIEQIKEKYEHMRHICQVHQYLKSAIPPAIVIALKSYHECYISAQPNSELQTDVHQRGQVLISFSSHLEFIPQTVQKQIHEFDT